MSRCTSALSTLRARGRLTLTRRPPSTTEPGAEAWRVAVRSAILACLGPTLVVSSSSIISAITRRPTATLMASSPSRAAPATSASCRRSSSDSSDSSVASSRSTRHSLDTVLLTAVPFQSVFLAERPTPTTRQVSGGGPPPHFNKIWDNLWATGGVAMHRWRALPTDWDLQPRSCHWLAAGLTVVIPFLLDGNFSIRRDCGPSTAPRLIG